MSPPEEEVNFRFLLYNLGGGLANILTSIIITMIMILTDDYSFWGPISSACIAIALVNLIPISSNIPNDGYNIKAACKSKEAKHGLYMMLFVNSELSSGKRLCDYSEDDFKVTDNSDFSNIFVIHLLILEAARLYDCGEYEKSINVYNGIDVNSMPSYYRNNIYADHLYYYIVHNLDYKLAHYYRNKKGMTNFLNLGIPTCTRIRAAYEYIINNNETQGQALLKIARKQILALSNTGSEKMENDYIDYLENKFEEKSHMI